MRWTQCAKEPGSGSRQEFRVVGNSMGNLDYQQLAAQLKRVDECLIAALKSRQTLITKALRELVNAGGKRFRPALVLVSGGFGSASPEKLIKVAAAVEMFHMATLVHDDIIDESRLRRGRETIQSQYGKDVAVFTGDYLFNQAFIILSEAASFDDLARVAKAVRSICEGEIEQYEARANPSGTTLLGYLRRIRRKTGILFGLSCELGALTAEAPSRVAVLLRRFGIFAGMAFQMVDDVLDLTVSEDMLGKPVANDIRQGIYTLPVIYALEHDSTGELAALLNSFATAADVRDIVRLVRENGGIDYTRKLARDYATKANEQLRYLPECPERQLLGGMVSGFIDREH